ncbi:MAG: hypothetical protein MUC79_04555 [Thiobacillaceae bacterium]|nr:hypothetical protein [Thiobacillaceae bacterium]
MSAWLLKRHAPELDADVEEPAGPLDPNQLLGTTTTRLVGMIFRCRLDAD